MMVFTSCAKLALTCFHIVGTLFLTLLQLFITTQYSEQTGFTISKCEHKSHKYHGTKNIKQNKPLAKDIHNNLASRGQ